MRPAKQDMPSTYMFALRGCVCKLATLLVLQLFYLQQHVVMACLKLSKSQLAACNADEDVYQRKCCVHTFLYLPLTYLGITAEHCLAEFGSLLDSSMKLLC